MTPRTVYVIVGYDGDTWLEAAYFDKAAAETERTRLQDANREVSSTIRRFFAIEEVALRG